MCRKRATSRIRRVGPGQVDENAFSLPDVSGSGDMGAGHFCMSYSMELNEITCKSLAVLPSERSLKEVLYPFTQPQSVWIITC
jgi:hypothetical protein